MANLSDRIKSVTKITLSLLLIGANTLFGEVLRPIQIIFPGNMNGNLLTFDSSDKAKGSDAFRLPYVVDKFRKEEDKDSIVFGLGNDSDAFKAFSFLTQGKVERETIVKSNPFSAAVSPNDLEVFNNSYLSPDIKKRIFTNVEAPDENSLIFERYAVTQIKDTCFYFFNFISPEYCSKLPLQRWSEIRADDPCRALRKINILPRKNDYTFSIVYGDKSTIDAITEELKNLDGIHFVINVPINGELPLFSYVKAEGGNQNVFRFSVQPGHLSLPILHIIPKNVGYPRTVLRMVPLVRYQNNNANKDFESYWEQYRQNFHKPLKVIPATNRATTSANRISLQAHAEMLKYATNSELAFLKLPDQISFTESVMTVGNTITRFPNDRIIRFKATEVQLKKMFLELLQTSNIKNLGFAGCQFSVLGVEYWDFKISKHAFDKNKRYTIVTTEVTAKEPVVQKLLKSCEIEPYNGLTLWEIWKENLQSFNMPENILFSK